MQQFRAAGSALAKLSPDSSTNKTTSIYCYWRNLIVLEAWTPHEQPIAKPILQVPLLQSTTACTCLASEIAATFPAMRSINKSHKLCAARHPSRVLHILGAGPSCPQKVQPQCSGTRLLGFVTQPAPKQGHLSAEHLGLLHPSGRGPATAAGTEAASAPGVRTDCKDDDGTSVSSALAAAEIKTCTRTQQET